MAIQWKRFFLFLERHVQSKKNLLLADFSLDKFFD